jgi:hypothetical protein
MAYVDVPGRFIYPKVDETIHNMNNPGLSYTLDAAGDYMAFIFAVPKTGTLQTVHIRQTQQTSIQDLRISFQDVDSINDPDGTDDQYRVRTPLAGDLNNYVSWGIISSNGTDGGVKRSVTQGDRLAIVIRFESTAGDIDILRGANRSGTSDEAGPYCMFSSDSGANWAPQQSWPAFMLEYTTGIVHVPECFPLKTRNTFSAGNASTPDEVGFKFQVPFKCKVVGAEFNSSAHTDAIVGIETSVGGVIATATNALWDGTDNAAGGRRTFMFDHAEVELEANTVYYLTWKPNTATSRSMITWNIEDAAARAGLPWGTTSSYNTRTDGGAWTEDTTITLLMSLIISAIDDGAGGAASCSYGAISNGTRVLPAYT